MTDHTFSTAPEPEPLDVERLTATMRAIMAANPRPGREPFVFIPPPLQEPEPDPFGGYPLLFLPRIKLKPMFIIHHEETTGERFDRWMARVEEGLR